MASSSDDGHGYIEKKDTDRRSRDQSPPSFTYDRLPLTITASVDGTEILPG